MKEYIERASIIPALEDYYEPINPDFPMTLELGQISEVLQNIPAADISEVRHGRWLTTDGYPHRLYCSVCYKTYAKNVKWIEELDLPVNYCPECGALMDGKEDEHD